MKIKNKLIFDYLKLKNTIKVTFFLSLFYFFTLFLRNKVNLEIFILLTILFSINFSLFYIYFSFKKELNYFPIYPLIIFYYFATCTAYFYLNYKLEPIFLLNSIETEWNERYI